MVLRNGYRRSHAGGRSFCLLRQLSLYAHQRRLRDAPGRSRHSGAVYEYPLVDFVSEALWPFHLHDVHTFNYQLREAQPTSKEDLVNRGQNLRNRGQSLVGQNPTRVTPPPNVAPFRC